MQPMKPIAWRDRAAKARTPSNQYSNQAVKEWMSAETIEKRFQAWLAAKATFIGQPC